MCEVAQRFAGWLGLGPGVEAALEYVFARWDGRGLPRDVGGDALPLPARLLHVARDFSLFLSAAGRDDACSVLERRAGEAYEPRLVELALGDFDDALAGLDEARMWEQALESEPFPHVQLSEDGIDAGFGAVAALTNLKSPWLREHSTRVAELAEAAAWRLRLAGRRRHGPTPRRPRARPRPRRRVERDLGEARAARIRRVGARPSAPALHRARVRTIADARSDRAPRGLSSRAARRFRLPPRRERLGARRGRARPRRRGLLLGHVRGEAAPAGARAGGRRGGADTRGDGRTARPGGGRRGARSRRPPRRPSAPASCPPV